MMRPAYGKIKVLECIRQGSIGGGESHLLSLSENLDKSVFEPIVLSMSNGPMIEKLKKMGIESHVIPSHKPFDIKIWASVSTFLKKRSFDIIHCHGTRSISNLFWSAGLLKVPLIYTIHGWSFHQDQNPWKKRLRIMGEKFLTKQTSVNISVSESNRSSGLKYISNLKSIVINNGIDMAKFNRNNNFKNVKTELGIPNQKILILFLARFTTHKQPLALIRAFNQLKDRLPELDLLMVGDGDEKEIGLNLVSMLGIADRVHFLPFREDVPDLLASADIYILPSLWEGMPIGLLEAMCMGKPVIATNVDGSREIIKNEENGLLINTDNLENSIASAILKLVENVQLRQKIGKKAIETVQEHYSASEMTRKVENVYLDISKRKKVY